MSNVKDLLRQSMAEARAKVEAIKDRTKAEREERLQLAERIGKLQDRMAELTAIIRKDDEAILAAKLDISGAAAGLGAKTFTDGQIANAKAEV